MDQREIFDSGFFESLHRMKLLKKLSSSAFGLWGNRKSGAKGNSLEYSDFREYILGDDWRRIDWNSYGRTDRLLVKLFVEEKECLFNIFVDCSSSMDFGNAHKGRCACRLCAALGFIILNQQDRVKVVCTEGGGIFKIPAMTGTASFPKLLRQLSQIVYTPDYNLWNVIRNESFQSKGVTVVISDFFLKTDLEHILKYLTWQKQKIVLLHVLCDEELHPGMDGTLNLIDSEDKKNIKVTMNSGVLKNYNKALEAFIERHRALAKKYHALYRIVPAALPLEKAFWEGLA